MKIHSTKITQRQEKGGYKNSTIYIVILIHLTLIENVYEDEKIKNNIKQGNA